MWLGLIIPCRTRGDEIYKIYVLAGSGLVIDFLDSGRRNKPNPAQNTLLESRNYGKCIFNSTFLLSDLQYWVVV